jgi:3-deoxy-manno-octulosonate cytidylyltransferase (CMP-KDO synthetase)
VNDFCVVIPARYASERLPGKPLLPLAGKPMLEHVWQRATTSGAAEVVVATDDARIADAAAAFGATVCMTAEAHSSGTDRIAEVVHMLDWPDDRVVVNLQGDEPLMPPALIGQCATLLEDAVVDIGTLASAIVDATEFTDTNVVKVVVDQAGNALYFSRAAIPFSRSDDTNELARDTALRHHGIYAYRCGVLRRLVAAEPAALERAERLEQLRALFLGMRIRVGIPSERPGPGVDTREDLERVASLLRAPGDSQQA